MLGDMFHVGQVVRCSVKGGSKAPAPTEVPTDVITELSVDPAVVNRNIKKSLIKPNMTLIGSIRSVEDNGYLLDAGIRKLEIFLPFSETPLKGLTF